jgi:hypothetical protein
MKITLTRSHAVLFTSGFALALLLSAAPVRAIFGGGVPNSFVAGEVASADEVNANFAFLENQGSRLAARFGTNTEFGVTVIDDDVFWQTINEFTFTSPNSGTAQIAIRNTWEEYVDEFYLRLTINGTPTAWLVEGDESVFEGVGDESAHTLVFRELSSGANIIRLEAKKWDSASPLFRIVESTIGITLLEN